MTFHIRKATYNDLPALANLHVQAWKDTYKGLMPQAHLDSLDSNKRLAFWQKAFLENSDPQKHPFIAEQNGILIGFVASGKGRHNILTDKGEIYAIYVNKRDLGKGVGYALFKAATDSLLEMGFSEVGLWVLTTNEQAKTAYAKWGGQIHAQTTETFTILDEKLTETLVTFSLQPSKRPS